VARCELYKKIQIRFAWVRSYVITYSSILQVMRPAIGFGTNGEGLQPVHTAFGWEKSVAWIRLSQENSSLQTYTDICILQCRTMKTPVTDSRPMEGVNNLSSLLLSRRNGQLESGTHKKIQRKHHVTFPSTHR